MTKEEAIVILKNISWQMGSVEREQNIEAFCMAIEALTDRPQSKWIICYDVDHSTDIYQCIQCHNINWYPSNYCPNCGAKMEKVNEK